MNIWSIREMMNASLPVHNFALTHMVDMDMDMDMEAVLSSCDLSHLTPSFAEQELTLGLLRSMAGAPAHWEESMAELGVHAADASRLQQALIAPGAASTGVESGASRASSSLPPAPPAFAQASISDLVASALSIVAATPAAPVADAAVAEAVEKPYRQGFSVTHINHVAPPQPKDSDALAAYKRRQLQQEVQQASSSSSSSSQVQRGGPASKPQARYSPAPNPSRSPNPDQNRNPNV
jgi:hypothetical protein